MCLGAACSNIPANGKNTLTVKPEITKAGNNACRLRESAWMEKVRLQAVLSETKTDDLPYEIDKRLQQSKTKLQSGYYPEAEQMLLQALELAGKAKDKKRSALVQTSLAHVYTLQENTREAKKHLSRGLADSRAFPEVAAFVFLQKGYLLLTLHEYGEAKQAFELSAELARKTGQEILEIKGIINLAMTALAQKQIPQTLKQLETAHEQIKNLPAAPEKIQLLIKTGQLAMSSAQKPTEQQHRLASASLKNAVKIAQEMGERKALLQATGALGHWHEQIKEYPEALRLTRRALFIAQESGTSSRIFHWAWQQGRILKKQKKINDAIRMYDLAVNTLTRGLRRDMSKMYRALGQTTFYKSVGPMYYQQADLLLQRAANGTEETQIQEDLRKARNAIEQLKTDELKDYFQDDCTLTRQEKTKTIDEVEPGTAVIYPILLDNRIELLVSVSEQPIQQFGKAISKKKVDETVTAFQESLQKTESDEYKFYARQLYSWLVEPLKELLEYNGIKNLVFVPEGKLRIIPMAALHDGRQFLIEQYALAITPGLTLTMTDSKLLRSEDIAGLLSGLTEVSPVYEEEGLWSPLPYSEAEVDHISEVYPNHQILTGEQFTKKHLIAKLGSGAFTVIHISSHAKFEGDPEESFVLTYDDKLKLNELGDLIKSAVRGKNPVELLTLSACETAKGDNERAALGLSGIAVKSGARSVLAALWSVDEQAAFQVISRFYKNLRGKSPVNKAQALRMAQEALLNSNYGHPYYWAPFLLIGNWS